ncbi:MAG: HAD family hydrolase [Candidatus Doudnabacteria bacterium]|nr:HAD family hydrolase [Candidatus Doudnabacteria bacterium]
MKIKAVIFDIDGVLIDSLGANAEFFAHFFRSIGHRRFSKSKYAEFNHMTMFDIIKNLGPTKSTASVRKLWRAAKKFPYPFDLVKVPSNAVSTVKSLSRLYRIGVVTSRVRASAADILNRYGFKRFVKVVVGFEDFRHPKPHPQPLRVALRRLKIKPREAVYVGDTETDLLSAKAAGVIAVYFANRKHKLADYHVSSFGQLADILRKYAG